MNIALKTQKLAAILACLLGLSSTPSLAIEPTKDAKFALVFLVSVEDAEIKPGSTAFVEPVFFTNGKELVFVYDYCRRDYERIHKGKGKVKIPARYKGPRGLADHEMEPKDLRAMRSFCAYEAFNLKGDGYYIHNSLGTRLRLSDIVFSDEGERFNELLPPQMPPSGKAQVVAVEGPIFPVQGREKFWGPKHYFLASTNDALLASIMPIQRTDEKQLQTFVERALTYVCDPNRMVIWLCLQPKQTSSTDKSDPNSLLSENPSYSSAPDYPRVGQIHLADLDGDGLLDAVLGLRALDRRKSMVGEREELDISTWSVSAFVYGNGKTHHRASYNGKGKTLTSFHYYMPLAILQIGSCKYLMTNSDYFDDDISLVTQPNETGACPNRKSGKSIYW